MRAFGIVFLFLTSFCFAESYQGVPGCECFANKELHEHVLNEIIRINDYGCTSLEYPAPYDYSDDYFQKRIAEGFLLGDYLQILDLFSKSIEEKKEHCIDLATYMVEHAMPLIFDRKLESVLHGAKVAHSAADALWEHVIASYRELLQNCPHKEPSNAAYTKNLAILCMVDRDYEAAHLYIKQYFDWCIGNGRGNLLTSDAYLLKGKIRFELGLYEQAISALTKSIQKDLRNEAAYITRAKAYFERGQFDLAVRDYFAGESFLNHFPNAPQEFEMGLFEGISLQRFEPSLCYSSKGLDRPLWAIITRDVPSAHDFVEACFEIKRTFFEYAKTLSEAQFREIAGEIRELYFGSDRLDERAQGRLMGKAVSRYGIAIFLGGKALTSAGEKLQHINALCNLEVLAVDKEKLLQLALAHIEAKATFLHEKERGVRLPRRDLISGANCYQELVVSHDKDWSIITHFPNRVLSTTTYSRKRVY